MAPFLVSAEIQWLQEEMSPSTTNRSTNDRQTAARCVHTHIHGTVTNGAPPWISLERPAGCPLPARITPSGDFCSTGVCSCASRVGAMTGGLCEGGKQSAN